MSLDDVRERVAARRRLARLGDAPSTAITLRDAEALCDLADAARDARNELRALEEWSRSHGYQHDAAMQREVVDAIDAALARLGGEDTG